MKKIMLVGAFLSLFALNSPKASAQYPGMPPMQGPMQGMQPGMGYPSGQMASPIPLGNVSMSSPGATPVIPVTPGMNYSVPIYGMNTPDPEIARYQNKYGFHPFIRRIFHLSSPSGCGCGGLFSKCNKACLPAPKPAPYPQNGTLAFPYNGMSRSPTDFFDKGPNNRSGPSSFHP